MRLKIFSAVILLIVLTSLFSFSQQTDIARFSTFEGFSYYATPSLNLVQRGIDADFGVNVRPWLTLGFDFSYGDGGSTLFPNKLSQAVQAQLAPIVSTLPPGFVLAVPFSAQDYTYEAGPQFNYRHFKHVTLFARPALGAIHVAFQTEPQACGQPQLGCQIILTQILNKLVGPTLSKSDTVVFYGFGGGVTWEITRNFGIRAATDFVHENFFSGLLDGGRNSYRVTVGTKFSFGKNIVSEGAPPSASCSASPTEVYPGDPVTATMNAQNFNPKHTVAYSWSGAGGKLSATSATATIDTTGLAPGAYAAIGTATDPKEKKNNQATCSANFTVKARPMNPPQASCSASPSTAKSGDPVTITASASSPDNAQITGYSYQASAGRISGTGPSATLDTSGATSGPISVTVTATDARNLTGSGSCSVGIEVPPPPPTCSKINSIQFPDAKRPWRVDNTAKAILDDVASRLKSDPNAKIVIIGYADGEKAPMVGTGKNRHAMNLAAQRGVNAKAYLVQEQGVDSSRVEVRQGTGQQQLADIVWVPQGADENACSDLQNTTAVDESMVQPSENAYPKPRAAAPAHHHAAKPAAASTQQ